MALLGCPHRGASAFPDSPQPVERPAPALASRPPQPRPTAAASPTRVACSDHHSAGPSRRPP
eukprot:10192329-Lingulodinium_polyedra.AAC.1